MILGQVHQRTPQNRIPRESGDDPLVVDRTASISAVFPARAGMIPTVSNRLTKLSGIPRESGDDPYSTVINYSHGRYSPRERG